jgi:leader peptidase (prepilin peptidase)/N-methyltransferase
LELYNTIFIAIIGIAFGSFINVLIYRVPKNINTISTLSFCPKCKTNIKFYDNIPILSFIILRAKCRFCKNKISFSYPIVELTVGLIFIMVFSRYMMTIESVVISIMLSLYFCLAIIDMKYYQIPDKISLIALLFAFVVGLILDNFFQLFIIIGFMSIVRFYVSYLVKKEAMGEGDLIIVGLMGAILGLEHTFVAIFVASVIALVPSLKARFNKRYQIPFIPYLFIGTMIIFYFNTETDLLLKYIYE